jgi:predicted transglutaminase-like cysteine proteinase
MQQARLGRENARISFKKTSRFAVCGVALALIGGAAEAQPTGALPSFSPGVSVRHTGAQPTMGWIRFCQQRPAECAVNPSEPATIQLTAQAWQTIVRINRQVNGSIKPMTDMAHWGVEDRWDLAEDGYGDCEDYQLVKRKKLAEAGFPRRALRMTVVIDELGEGHAVLMVRTDRGEFILDNKRNAVLPWHRTGYTFLKREGDAGSAWVSLGGTIAASVATAGR